MLKVDSPQPPMNDMPPMDMGADNQIEVPPMNDMPPMDMGADNQIDGDFDTNFDAGVDADEETDPKKYIQQLTGKLSQSLRKYNEEQGQPDIDLSKYVCGMINAQATEGLNQEDVDEILNKIKSGESFEDNEQNMQPAETDDQQQTEEQPPMPNESLNHKQMIDEIFQDLTKQSEENSFYEKPVNIKNSFRKKPFTSPNFK